MSASSTPVPPGSDDWSGPPPSDGLYRSGGGLFDDATQRLSRPTDPPSDADADVDAEPAPRPRGRWAVFAVVLATLALVAAVASSAFAWQAFDRADAARTIAVRLQPVGSTATSIEPTAEVSDEPYDAASAGPSDDPGLLLESSADPDPDASAEPADGPTDGPTQPPADGYQQEPMKFQIGCSAALFVDLDEPRANVDDTHHDLRYDSRCGTNNPTLALGPGADGGSQVSADTRTAADCGKQIRTSPLGPRAVVPVRKGLLLCVLTSLADARERDDTQKIVLLEVTGLSERGTASLRATSWIIRE